MKIQKDMISKQSIKFPHDKLHDAVLYAQDILDRAMVPFVLLEETAKQMMGEMPQLSLEEISIGVMKRHWTSSCQSIFYGLIPKAEGTKSNITFTYNGVPIIIWIIENNYVFFENPDTRWYYTSEFKIPNPFSLYWKERFIVK